MEDRSNGSISISSTAGFIKSPDWEPKEVWEVGLVEQTPFRRDSQTDFTNIGTAFRTGEGVIEMTLKPGISVSGTVVLRKK